ncbi:MAG: pyrroline-5-carboxylate reductase [Bacteroidetes bacterium GWE2_41_25]|nr:MAG: pyrroline-5-carboxylate reductase [Bacteroidetes bacterium GWA2_40_15]OFX92250.1 MAG: pyrroline-5-carboxylate reductase [Bacteroidetes bacterium GWC2_40_22]OFY02059.1 MAG: pyrroline-5-carboxylate reductase [Bacteroidetes bacterium GWE2_41_25]OFY61928.1 MAG: pyrroline-5-carboxylate reductase [Bacteroidetes bacterium GWF2_41_9]HAM09071.1 pyrroline-5-carboxylate reductase [Bacteroidales bacterium]
MKKRLAIIGCGNIGLSLLQGLMKDKTLPPGNITVTRRNIDELTHLKDSGVKITSDNTRAVQNSDIVLIAVKPYNILNILEEIKDHLKPDSHILVSVTAGVTIKEIQEKIGLQLPVFRAMPNISASVGKSVSCICHNNAGSNDIESVRTLFNALGTSMIIDEELMQSATILGACGVAYVMRFIRAMIQGGIQIGFDAKTASEIVNQTVKGAAELLIQRQGHPESEIDKVTTPKGCTIVGLNEMEHNGFSSSLIKGIVASYEKIEK